MYAGKLSRATPFLASLVRVGARRGAKAGRGAKGLPFPLNLGAGEPGRAFEAAVGVGRTSAGGSRRCLPAPVPVTSTSGGPVLRGVWSHRPQRTLAMPFRKNRERLLVPPIPAPRLSPTWSLLTLGCCLWKKFFSPSVKRH